MTGQNYFEGEIVAMFILGVVCLVSVVAFVYFWSRKGNIMWKHDNGYAEIDKWGVTHNVPGKRIRLGSWLTGVSGVCASLSLTILLLIYAYKGVDVNKHNQNNPLLVIS